MQSKEELEREQSQNYSEKQKCEQEINKLEEKIDRLKKFKSKVATYKSDVFNMANPFLNYTSMCCDQWKGEKYNWFHEASCINIYDDFELARDKIDDMLDRVCDKIRELENQIHDTEGLLGQIMKALNNIATALEKWAN